MPTTFSKADKEITSLLDTVLHKWHGDLHKAGVRIYVIMAYNPEGPAVKHGGYPASGKIKVYSLKDRLKTGYDAELTIDQTDYEDMTPEQRVSFHDHECSHLALVMKKKKKKADPEEDDSVPYKVDDLGRPKLKSVDGDWNVGDGFSHVVARHGLHAIEYRNIATAKRLADKAREEGKAA